MTLPNVAVCDNCGGDVIGHRACPECGWYRGRVAAPVKRDDEIPEELEE